MYMYACSSGSMSSRSSSLCLSLSLFRLLPSLRPFGYRKGLLLGVFCSISKYLALNYSSLSADSAPIGFDRSRHAFPLVFVDDVVPGSSGNLSDLKSVTTHGKTGY